MKTNYALVVLGGLLLTGCGLGVKNHAQFETASVACSNLVQYATATGSLGAVVSADVGARFPRELLRCTPITFGDQERRAAGR